MDNKQEYTEFYICPVANDHDQHELIGSKDNRGYHVATYNNLHYAELAAAFLNQMLEEDK